MLLSELFGFPRELSNSSKREIMFNIPKKVNVRIVNAMKKFQPIIRSAANRDVNETDTVTIIKDFFAECFGFDKYSELTSEYAIRGTFCDLAVKLQNEVKL